MGFLDDIKSRLGMAQPAAEPYGDEPYDDYYDEGVDGGYEDYPEGYGQPAQDSYRGYEPQEPGNGMLGQTRRGEAESVAVYTRSGQLVGRPIAMRRPTALPPSLLIVPVPTTLPRATPRLRISARPCPPFPPRPR